MERILLALEAQGVPTEAARGLDVFVVAGTPVFETEVFALVHELRAHGIAADMDFGKARAVKKQFEQADKTGARYALVIGDEEKKNAAVAVKNMATGEQATAARGHIVEHLRKVL